MLNWTNKKISMVAMLIATSVVFVILGTQLFAITAFPSFKVAFGGLPVKITGFVFGPIIGAITGALADLLSFVLIPINYHPGYTLIMAMAGFVPGVVMLIMVRKKRSANVHLISTLIVLFLIFIGILLVVTLSPNEHVSSETLKHKDGKENINIKPVSGWASNLWNNNRWLFFILPVSGVAVLSLMLVGARVFGKKQTFIGLAPIIMFVAILEVNNDIQTPFWDSKSLGIPFQAALVGHLSLMPLKLVTNVFIIYFAWRILYPLITKNKSSSYQDEVQKKYKTIYVCGPTVYDKAHIGNMRPILSMDIYNRASQVLGHKFYMVHNITNIDDKIINRAISENVSEREVSNKYYRHYLKLLKELNIKRPYKMPKVTKHIQEIIDYITILIDTGFAYEQNGSVYFSVKKIPLYGNLSNRKFTDMQMEKSSEKEFAGDFVIWKKTSIGKKYKSPWSEGRPGWHTECAMFIDLYFNQEQVDIHGGGNDLLFPHNENENAQSWALRGRPISDEWKHFGLLKLQGIKMSKSIGNIWDTEEFNKEYGKDTLRALFLSSSYSAPLDISESNIKNAQDLVYKLRKSYAKALLFKNKETLSNAVLNFAKDIESWRWSAALKKINVTLKSFNKENAEVFANDLIGMIKVIGFNFTKNKISRFDIKKYNTWKSLKEKGQYKKADLLRDDLMEKELI